MLYSRGCIWKRSIWCFIHGVVCESILSDALFTGSHVKAYYLMLYSRGFMWKHSIWCFIHGVACESVLSDALFTGLYVKAFYLMLYSPVFMLAFYLMLYSRGCMWKRSIWCFIHGVACERVLSDALFTGLHVKAFYLMLYSLSYRIFSCSSLDIYMLFKMCLNESALEWSLTPACQSIDAYIR